MKNLFLTTAAALFLLTACSKDESFEPVDAQMNEPVYVLDQNRNQDAFEIHEVNNSQKGVKFKAGVDNSDFGYTSGLYQPMNMDPVVLSWSAIKDETGTYGTAELLISRTNYTIHVIMEAECISVEGDTAMYGAVITEVVELSGDAPPLTANWRYYFQVKDNQNGSGIGSDQISNTSIFASPRTISLCNLYPPKDGIWYSNGHSDVLNPGFVEVSNNPQ